MNPAQGITWRNRGSAFSLPGYTAETEHASSTLNVPEQATTNRRSGLVAMAPFTLVRDFECQIYRQGLEEGEFSA